MKSLKATNFFNYKSSTPIATMINNTNDSKRKITFLNCPNLLQSPKKIILNSSSYKSFMLENKPNKTFEMKYPSLSTNNSSKKLLLDQSKPSLKQITTQNYSNKTKMIPRPRVIIRNNMSRNKPIYHFNSFNLSQQQQQCNIRDSISKTNTNTTITTDANFNSNNVILNENNNKPDLISARSFIDEITNLKNAIKENLYYHRRHQKHLNILKESINSTITAYLSKKQSYPSSKENQTYNLNSTTLTKTIQISSIYTIELKLISYSVYFKQLNNANNKTIVLPFEFVIYFLSCQKQIDLIINFLSYNQDNKEFFIDHNKFKLSFLSQVSIDRLNYTYKEPMTSIWITMTEQYQFTTIPPQMTFTLFDANSHQKLCHFTKLLDSQIVVNLMKDNFAHWDLLVLNSFSIYKAFRRELFNIFSLKQHNPIINRTHSKISINNSHRKVDLLKNSNEIDDKEDDEKTQNEQLGKHSWDFISTINNITHCHTLCSFRIEIRTESGIIRTLSLTLKQLNQIVNLSNQWSLYETLRRLLIVDDNYYPRLNVLFHGKGEKINEYNNSNHHKYKRSISITKKEELSINKKEPSGYSYIDKNRVNIKFIDPFFVNEEKIISIIPMDLIISMAKLPFSDWPVFIRNHYDILFNKKFDLAPTTKKKGLRSSKSLRIGLIKRRFQNN